MKFLTVITVAGVILVLLGGTPELGVLYEAVRHIENVVPLQAFFIPILAVWFVKFAMKHI